MLAKNHDEHLLRKKPKKPKKIRKQQSEKPIMVTAWHPALKPLSRIQREIHH